MAEKHTYVLGINADDHDVSACLLRDGEIAYAIAKEMSTRRKHAAGFFQEAVDYVLAAEGIKLEDVDLVVRNSYVLPVEELEVRLLSIGVPEIIDERERSVPVRGAGVARVHAPPPRASSRTRHCIIWSPTRRTSALVT